MTKNIINGIISIFIGFLYLIMSLNLPKTKVGDKIGAALFPEIISIIAICCGIALILIEVLKNKNRSKEKVSLNLKKNKTIYVRILLTIISGLIYGCIIDRLGYVISTFLFMIAVMCIINSTKKIKENIVISLCFSIATYGAFALLLKLSLPRGILPF